LRPILRVIERPFPLTSQTCIDERIERLLGQHGVDYVRGYVDALKEALLSSAQSSQQFEEDRSNARPRRGVHMNAAESKALKKGSRVYCRGNAVTAAMSPKRAGAWGANPKGAYMFSPDGRFTQMLFHTDLPKIDNRMGGTPDQHKAIAQGVVAMYGSYTVDEANKTIIVKFEGSSFVKFVGTEGKRVITPIDDNEFRSSNPATSLRHQGRIGVATREVVNYAAIHPGKRAGVDFCLHHADWPGDASWPKKISSASPRDHFQEHRPRV
jgi:hypothetical protein